MDFWVSPNPRNCVRPTELLKIPMEAVGDHIFAVKTGTRCEMEEGEEYRSGSAQLRAMEEEHQDCR
jgi:hypothetical protein